MQLQLVMQQGQQQETKLLQATRLVLLPLLPQAVTTLQGQQVIEEEQQQADQQQVKVKDQAAAPLQAVEEELPVNKSVTLTIQIEKGAVYQSPNFLLYADISKLVYLFCFLTIEMRNLLNHH
jgi:hypothetical protein